MTTPTTGQPAVSGPAARSAQEIFESLDDHGKNDFVDKELDDVYDGLDRLIKKLGALKVKVESEDGRMAVTVAYNGRTVELYMDDGLTTQRDHLSLEREANELAALAWKEIQRMRQEIENKAIEFMPPG
ncbi:hypothetical protein [Mycobacteroides abscessus]|uniref:YbaB/EbfC family DNA-binding protein n=1 Tax=Mycobacteroides abscessus subsp. bolletii 50594 TaxID=1303024 RepID=A0AB33AJ58_9MYCO|nr:hypothetical protein [Mycobacteroides abscessus]AGM31783.1 hypothetical protein MASS_2p0072 [Mycobacteroides abscessus subsp. bolletii 50594]MBN7379385.1 hypothetical protein [Mycobacteroides abscessus subsp. massiliense]MBN7468699.1 hypothetical protein [Mycobacteroides abscessus subsp. massiliense]MDO2972758.1 hypothetical protein [Mycobacteroides abscessus subsp. bolletii]MDO3081047.1 hypothetical protein [Mycobacteroides abscessus subsp. bolletii]